MVRGWPSRPGSNVPVARSSPTSPRGSPACDLATHAWRLLEAGMIAEPRPAATVVLLRDGADGVETLLLLRSRNLGFHGGEWVFPGGRVDPSDAEAAGGDLASESAARRAAAREAMEEAGVALSPEAFVAYAHWTTPTVLPKRFATYFFLVAVGDAEVSVDGSEIEAHRWLRPREALALRDQGELGLPPPTFVTLTELADFARAEHALEAYRARPVPILMPHVAMAEDCVVNLLPGDAGYADTDPHAPGPRHRVVMRKGPWAYERG